MEQQKNPYPTFCASPFDPGCATGLHLAYQTGIKKKVVICDGYFGKDQTAQTYILFHELTHEFATDVQDLGYGSDRIFSYLTPDEAIHNADSYALFALDL